MQISKRLTKKVSKKTNVPEHLSRHFIQATLEGIEEILCEGETLTLKEFGTFFLRWFQPGPAFLARQSGKSRAKPRFVPRFKPSKRLKQRVKESLS